MSVASHDQRLRCTAFFVLMVTINLAGTFVTRTNTNPDRRTLIALAATLDVTVVVSAIYYWLIVRPGIRHRRMVLPIALLGLLHATYFLPDAGRARAALAGLCETGIVVLVVLEVRRNRRRSAQTSSDADPVVAIRTALGSVFGLPVITRLVAGEMSVLYYGLFSWRARPHVPAGAIALTIHQRIGHADIFAAFPLLCTAEMVPLHLLLHKWSPLAAWIATAVSGYSMMWLIGLARAFRLRPVLVGEDTLHIRYGLLFDLEVPRDAIVRVRAATPADQRYAVPRRSEPVLCIEFNRTLEAEAIFGVRRRVHRVALTPDDPAAFEQALAVLLQNG